MSEQQISRLPFTRRLSGLTLWFTVGFYLIIAWGGAGAVGWHWFFDDGAHAWRAWVGGALVVVGAIGALAAPSDALTFEHDAIERRQLLSFRRLTREEIEGYRLERLRYGLTRVIVVPYEGDPMTFIGLLGIDPVIQAWLSGFDRLPD